MQYLRHLENALEAISDARSIAPTASERGECDFAIDLLMNMIASQEAIERRAMEQG